MSSLVETLTPSQRDHLRYAASFRNCTMIYGAKLDVTVVHLELERILRDHVAFIDMRTILDPAALERELAKTDKIHIAIDWIITPEVVAVLRRTLGPRVKRRVFAVLSTRATVPSELGHDLREIFPVLMPWDEVV
jgi:hypothetical protein